MKPGLQVGELREIVVEVDEQSKASLLGGPVHPLYGTAGMIAHMEWAARQHILPYLEEGEDGVGYRVDVTHLKPAPVGAPIKVRSRVTDIRPKRVTSQVEAWWKDTKVGEGIFTQALVSREKLYASAVSSLERYAQPAELRDTENNVRFSLDVLRWEHEFSACTRYDEWLIVRVKVNSTVHEGAFLLRYEIEEWQQACNALTDKVKAEYQSDFLEAVLGVRMLESSECGVEVTLRLAHSKSPDHPPETLQFNTKGEHLKRFSECLSRQLDGFPSQL